MSALEPPASTPDDALRAMELLEASLRKEKKDKEKKKDKKDDKKEKGGGSTRGIETMFRTTLQSHNDLVGLADNKANMMISVNGLIISILLASMGGGGWMVFPSTALMIGCLGSIVFAVLAARPRVTRNSVSMEDVRAGRANLLFFGNFLNLPMDDYLEAMRTLMENPDEAYKQMVRNLYALGHILEKKFKLLWISYTFFLAGLGGAVLLFLVMFARGMASSGIVVP
jgi:hypothetical protein